MTGNNTFSPARIMEVWSRNWNPALPPIGQVLCFLEVKHTRVQSMRNLVFSGALTLVFTSLLMQPASANVGQDAIDGCIDRIRAVGGPDGQSGTVISTEYSEANSLVMFGGCYV